MGEQATVPRRITHVIFDMDGLILDTEGLYTVAQQRILSRFNREFTWALKVKMMGKKAAEAAKVVIEELGLQGEMSAEEFLKERENLLREEFPHCKLLPEELGLQGEMSAEEFLREREREEFSQGKLLPGGGGELGLQGEMSAEEFLREREAPLREEFPHCKLLPGAERLIRHLHEHNIPMAIGTGSHKIHFGLKTANHTALFSLMRHSVLGDDPEVVNGKPAPDVFRVAAARFDPPPSPDNVLVFEDAPLGVDAARNAGM
ncbi:unnamed protein product [Closterium sp. Naga37s-1]|nr:unnamed protein product [Closterium sp. Naga37s-1]